MYICTCKGVTKLGYLGIYRSISGFRGFRLRIHRSQSFTDADDDDDDDGVGV